MASIRLYEKRYGGNIETASVNIADLHVTRPWVNEEKVRRYMNPWDYMPSVVIQVTDGTKYLVDGHHRTTANFLRGDETILAEVLVNTKKRLESILRNRDCGNVIDLAVKLSLNV